MAWTQNGPVSVPPQTAVYFIAALVAVLAVAGAGLGFRAASRESGRPSLGGEAASVVDDAVLARPIVVTPAELQQTAVAAAAASNAAQAGATNAIAAETAAAQEVQAKPSKTPTLSPDEILTSPTEKPQAAAKPAQDETPPKSDVPF